MVGEKDGHGPQDTGSPSASPVGESEASPSGQHSTEEEDRGKGSGGVYEAALVQYTKSLARWTAVLVFSTISLGIVAFFQWQELRHTDETLQRTLVASNRAWATPTVIKLANPITKNKPIFVLISIDNIGNEPALNVTTRTEVGEKSAVTDDVVGVAKPSGDASACRSLAATDQVVIYPKQSHVMMFESLCKTCSEDVLVGKSILIVNGCIAYSTFGTVHHSAYCFFLDPKRDKPANEWFFSRCSGGEYAN